MEVVYYEKFDRAGVSVDTLLKKYEIELIDIFRIDIELTFTNGKN